MPVSARERLEELLEKTSRTFALSIPPLPEPTRREVTVAYLLFRIADTLEDAVAWPHDRKVDELGAFARLLENPSADEAERLALHWQSDPPLDHAGYRELLAETPAVVGAWLGLGDAARKLVGAHTRRTIERMGSFVERERDGVLQLADVHELRTYCYAVAGIVGEMLTELFLLDRPPLAPIAAELRRDAARFGEALQLVNILKDVRADIEEGRSFLPPDLDPAELFRLARRDLAAAGGYSRRLHEAGAPRGIVAFTLLPVLLAHATLNRVERDGPGSKLTRPEVRAILDEMESALNAGTLGGLSAISRTDGEERTT